MVGPVGCAEQLVPDGEGLRQDLWMANSQFRAVIRHPLTATTVHAGGGTVVDLAPWGHRDRLHEAVPLVGGGWLDVDGVEIEADRIRISGAVVSLPDRPASAVGERREVAWVIAPDDPVLRLEGADGLWLHGSGDHEQLDGLLWGEALVFGHDGLVAEDLGGALRIHGVTGLYAAAQADGIGLLSGEMIRVTGAATGAEALLLYADGAQIGRAPVVDDTFDLSVPAHVDAVRAVAEGHVPSPTAPPSEGLVLALGPRGVVDLTSEPSVTVTWSADDGRAGRVILPPGGGEVPTGAGAIRLRVQGGPAWLEAEHDVEIAPGSTLSLDASPDRAFAPGPRVLAALTWPGDRSRTFRGSDATALSQAAGAGIGFVVVTPEDDVADVRVDDAPLRWRNGSMLLSSAGWRVVSWPWRSAARQPGHGAVPQGLPPTEALAMAWGGAGVNRFTAVDLAWLEAIGRPPWEVEPRPDFVILPPPSADGPAWSAWFRWLDAGEDLIPVGPLAWVDVGDPHAVAAVDVEDGLIRGRAVATTGPLVLLRVGDAVPGDVATLPGDPGRSLWAEIVVRGEGFDRIALYGSGGRELGRWSARDRLVVPVTPGRWLVAAAWSDDGEAWAVTSPIWFDSATP